MKKLCIALCFSLFASLIHAGSMSASNDLAGPAHAQHLVQHDCHTNGDTNIDKSQSTNHQTHHQCCLGVVANLSTNQYTQPDLLSHYTPQVSLLVVEAFPAHIFKPPRQFS